MTFKGQTDPRAALLVRDRFLSERPGPRFYDVAREQPVLSLVLGPAVRVKAQMHSADMQRKGRGVVNRRLEKSDLSLLHHQLSGPRRLSIALLSGETAPGEVKKPQKLPLSATDLLFLFIFSSRERSKPDSET